MTNYYHVVTTRSIHQIRYIVSSSLNLTIEDVQKLLKEDACFEVDQKWLGEEVTEMKQLTPEQVSEIMSSGDELVHGE